MQQMEAARGLESASIGDGGLRSANFDGDLASGSAGTMGWGLGGPDGRYAIFNDIVLRGGIIGNDALTSPITAASSTASASAFGLTQSWAMLATTSLVVPAGFTRGLFTSAVLVNARNSRTESDYIFVAPYINGAPGNVIYNGISGNGGSDGTLNIMYKALTGLTGGQSVVCAVSASTNGGPWDANASNTASVDAQVVWMR